MVALDLCCLSWAFSSCDEWGLLFVVVNGLLIVVVSLVVECRLSCSQACGIFPDQGLSWCPLLWQTDSQPQDHQGSPAHSYLDDGNLIEQVTRWSLPLSAVHSTWQFPHPSYKAWTTQRDGLSTRDSASLELEAHFISPGSWRGG